MRRRALVAGTLALPAAALGQTAPRPIGWLTLTTRASAATQPEAISGRLAARGHAVNVHARFAEADASRLDALAQELVALEPVAIVGAGGNAAIAALRRATARLPVVMFGSIDPVGSGLVASLGRPGGNVTGGTYTQPEFAGKVMEVLRLAAPAARRVTLIWNPTFPGMRSYRPHADRTAANLGLTLTYMDISQPADFAIEALARTRPQAIYLVMDQAVWPIAPKVAAYAREHRLASIGTARQYIDMGGAMAFMSDPGELEQIVTDCLDRILRGANPSDIPVRAPSKFMLTLHRKAAQESGVTLSRELLLMANEVIE